MIKLSKALSLSFLYGSSCNQQQEVKMFKNKPPDRIYKFSQGCVVYNDVHLCLHIFNTYDTKIS